MSVRGLPMLLTEQEALRHTKLSVDEFRKKKLKPAGSYTPPRARSVPLYSRSDVDKLVIA